jgi:small Trp-rich protein
MPLIILIAALAALRALGIWKFADLSWWWIVGLMLAAFIWFEFIEKALGLDKKKQHSDEEKRRRERVKKSFGKK